MSLCPYWYNLLRYYTPICYSQLLRYHSYWYNNLILYYTPINTASYYDTIPLLIQQLTLPISNRNSKLSWYYTSMLQHPITLIYPYYATILLLIQQYNLLLYSDWYNKLLCYYTTIDSTIVHYYPLIDTTSYYAPISLWIHNQVLCYYSPTDTASYHAIILILIQLLLLFPNWYSKLICYLYLNWYSQPLCYYNNLNTVILDTAISTTTIQQWFSKLLCPYDTLDTKH